MTDILALAGTLRSQLTPEERAQLVVQLIGRQGDTAQPDDAVRVFDRASSGLIHSLYERPLNGPVLDDVAATMFFTFDGLAMALEHTSRHAPGDANHSGPASGWRHSRYNALNLRDSLQSAVSDDYDWDNHRFTD